MIIDFLISINSQRFGGVGKVSLNQLKKSVDYKIIIIYKISFTVIFIKYLQHYFEVFQRYK